MQRDVDAPATASRGAQPIEWARPFQRSFSKARIAWVYWVEFSHIAITR
ncbi:hypothetical protein [Paraburkholderia sp. IW21]